MIEADASAGGYMHTLASVFLSRSLSVSVRVSPCARIGDA